MEKKIVYEVYRVGESTIFKVFGTVDGLARGLNMPLSELETHFKKHRDYEDSQYLVSKRRRDVTTVSA